MTAIQVWGNEPKATRGSGPSLTRHRRPLQHLAPWDRKKAALTSREMPPLSEETVFWLQTPCFPMRRASEKYVRTRHSVLRGWREFRAFNLDFHRGLSGVWLRKICSILSLLLRACSIPINEMSCRRQEVAKVAPVIDAPWSRIQVSEA